ncbi:MAG TPA: sulfite exporter TauE/SafE family protein [Anaerolineae bacterium]|nr:sulfite exporter TauE/SafE family protein [Anaerolineae bacterium]
METILLYALVGFVAQMIDGALGMAYGVSSNTFLLSMGVPPAIASASVHIAEMFTTGISGLSHFRLGNVDAEVFKRLIVPGVLGGVLGAYVLTTLPSDVIKPLVSLYLLIMGVRILLMAWKKLEVHDREPAHWFIPLGLAGGFLDAIGGGGWGPIVTTTLVASGRLPHKMIGSVNASEFFVTLAESVTFILTLGTAISQHWQSVLGLLSGGIIAAPLAAYVCRKLPTRVLLVLVGAVIILLSLRTLYLAWF